MPRSFVNTRHSFSTARVWPAARAITASVCVLVLLHFGTPAFADSYPQVPSQAGPQQNAAQLLSRDQLDNLVAPVALYPDELLGEILAASTYPLEIVEAAQWLQQNESLQGDSLIEAAKQQDWDPSVQVLVGFPDVVDLMNRDVRWTTDLGNAFLAQQADVMNAIQVMRLRAKNNGRLTSTPQQVVSSESQNGQYAIKIEPANPQVIYPPVYSPEYVWGPPPAGAYPPVTYYPAPASYNSYGYGGYGQAGYGSGGYGSGGYGFGAGINIASLFSGLMSFNGWGWVLGWFSHSLSLASLFFNVLGFHGFGGGGYAGGGGYGGYGYGPAVSAGLTLWSHNPAHRLGVAYPRGFAVPRSAGLVAATRPNASRFAASASPAAASRVFSGSEARSNPAPYNRTGSEWQQRSNPASSTSYRSDMSRPPVSSSYGNVAPQQRASTFDRNSYQNSPGTVAPQASNQRYFAQPQQQRYSGQRMASSHYSEPKMSTPHYSAPKYSAPKYSAPKFSAPKFSAPKSSGGGHSGGKSSHKR